LDPPFRASFDLINPTPLTEPQLAGDVEGNGIADIINYDKATGRWSVSCAQICTLSPGATWLTGFGNIDSLPLVGDWNSDGRTDVATFEGGTWRFALSTGSSFQANAIPEISFGRGTPLSGDFNGDGTTDIATYNTGDWQIALGGSSGFTPTAFTLNKTDVNGGGVPLPVLKSVREYLDAGMSHGDGTYTIDPDGPGGQAPINVDGFMSVSGGGWTKLTETVANSLLNTDASLEREYLYYKPSVPAWYRSPVSRLTWDWRSNFGKDLYGTYYHSEGGSFNVTSSSEHTLYGVSGSSGPGGTFKCLIAHEDSKDPSIARINLCQDQPNIFHGSACQSDVFVYIRERSFPNKFFFGSSGQHLTGDFNGDGLTDLAVVDGANLVVGFSDGRQFREQPPWAIGFGSGEYLSADFNGDGLSDLGFFDRSNGRVVVGHNNTHGFNAPVNLPFTFTQIGAADQIQLADFNGDALPDPAVFNNVTGNIEFAISQGNSPDLLNGINNGVGGATAITYRPASHLGQHFLPFLTPLVTETRVSDGLGNTYTNTYSYSQGLYDGTSKEFRGFGRGFFGLFSGSAGVRPRGKRLLRMR
jgi:hypothetical protein